MADLKRIKTALISVYNKNGLEEIVHKLMDLQVRIVSTGGTKEALEKMGAEVISVEDITTYPSILGGRVKTLHPKIFGGILYRRDSSSDKAQAAEYSIEGIDLVIVDLYPFEKTVHSGATDEEIIEKIDIGGISLIRAAAKNFNDVVIVPSCDQYPALIELLKSDSGNSSLDQRKWFAAKAFEVTSHYDTVIYEYFSEGKPGSFQVSIPGSQKLRYGENPHQEGYFFGDFDSMFTKLAGKEISYNNLLDIDSAVALMNEFEDTSFAILKHNNACGVATREDLLTAWKDALAGDPVSAYGGVLITNRVVDGPTADEINKLFFEVIIAPGYEQPARDIFQQKKNRIILVLKNYNPRQKQFRSVLNGALMQDRDSSTEHVEQFSFVTDKRPTEQEISDLIFANKLVKHTKSNAIVLAKNQQLLASGTGQTSRIDAMQQAIAKSTGFGFDLRGAVMASDAFFPFADSVEVAYKAGITAVIQPGGSVRDKDSIDFCNKAGISMVFTGIRHFKH
jgi:phosphoribosylaminoimidazolecarboxamide formyltransferase/IMP cyclohydrolase